MKLTSCLRNQLVHHTFVPNSFPVLQQDVIAVQSFISQAKALFVLTGAGISTESGIPDYRSETVGLYARTDHRPVQYAEFISSASARQKYWARNFVGWPSFSSFLPNQTHTTLSQWEQEQKIQCLVTQNVDGLHSKAGSKNVIELHGSSFEVQCLACHMSMSRKELQTAFEALNPTWSVETLAQDIAPDGDVILDDEIIKKFKVPNCFKCGGVLKPNVIFFGDNVPRHLVEEVFQKLSACDSILVLGSSLYVWSGYRFVKRAKESNKKVAIINIGQTRADHLANVKVEVKCGDILPLIKTTV